MYRRFVADLVEDREVGETALSVSDPEACHNLVWYSDPDSSRHSHLAQLEGLHFDDGAEDRRKI